MRLELSNTFTVKAVIRHLIQGKQAEEICSSEYTFVRPGSYNMILRVCIIHKNVLASYKTSSMEFQLIKWFCSILLGIIFGLNN